MNGYDIQYARVEDDKAGESNDDADDRKQTICNE